MIPFFCINDTTDDAHLFDPRLVRVRETLQAMFAVPSRFEATDFKNLQSSKKGRPAKQLLQPDPVSTR